MKKLFFIASVGLLFSCNNGGTCVCTTTYTGSDANQLSNGGSPVIYEVYYENDAQENCDANQSNLSQQNSQTNSTNQQIGLDVYQSTSCVVE